MKPRGYHKISLVLPTLTETLEDVGRECKHQAMLHGDQRHPDGTGLGQGRAASFERTKAAAFARGAGTWVHVLTAEVLRTAETRDQQDLEEGLQRVAATCVAWLRDLKRRPKK